MVGVDGQEDPRRRRTRTLIALRPALLTAVVAFACTPADPMPVDPVQDVAVLDAAPKDARMSDARTTDARIKDADLIDQSVIGTDAAQDMLALPDMRPPDMLADLAPPDMMADLAPPDMMPPDMLADLAPPDMMPPDMLADLAPPDMMPPDMRLPDMMLGPARAPVPGDLVITEVLAEPEAVRDAQGEWFEVHNQSDAVLDLEGLVLTNGRAGQLAERTVIQGLRPVAPGAFGVVGRVADPAVNGGAILHGRFDDMTLSNSTDAVVLFTPDGREIDRVGWDNGVTFPDVPGASMQLDLDVGYAIDNADGALWCASRSSFGAGDRGTPGARNIACRGAFTAPEFQELIVRGCPGCHTERGRLGGLNLDDHTQSIGRAALQVPALNLIEPGDRRRSYLYLKLTDEQASVGGDGTVMPQEGALDADTIERVGRYIDALPR